MNSVPRTKFTSFYKFVGAGWANPMLHVIDFSNPQNLSLLNYVPLDDLPYHMKVLDNNLITSCTSSAQLWSLSNPLNPSELDSVSVQGRVCAQESENLIFNGTVLSVEGSSFSIVQTFDTHGGGHYDGFPYGRDVTNIENHSIIFLAQSERVLVLRSVVPESTGSINGHVTDIAGEPLRALVITINSETKEKDKAVTDVDGDYKIPELEPGTYLVLCIKRGYKLGIKKAEVVAGETTTVDFQLIPK